LRFLEGREAITRKKLHGIIKTQRASFPSRLLILSRLKPTELAPISETEVVVSKPPTKIEIIHHIVPMKRSKINFLLMLLILS